MSWDVIDSSVVKGLTQQILFSFILEKPSKEKVFCEPETLLYGKIKKFVWKTITFYSEGDNHQEVRFNGETWKFYITVDENLNH